jgi:DNA-binding GntR family transcriptional regulator
MAKTGKMIYQILKDRILNDTYAPNEPLVESALAEELGVGRNTIRNALLLLEGDKLIEMKESRSATVKYLTKAEVIELYEIRERLEGLIAYHCANILTEAELGTLKECVDQMKLRISQQKLLEYSETNNKFHKVLYEACKNKETMKLLDSINWQLRRYKKRTILIAGRGDNSCAEHERIYHALSMRNAAAAEAAMREHIANVRRTLSDNYDILY